jgi:hypothetical protein
MVKMLEWELMPQGWCWDEGRQREKKGYDGELSLGESDKLWNAHLEVTCCN